jgi:hypothetical protein
LPSRGVHSKNERHDTLIIVRRHEHTCAYTLLFITGRKA